MAEKEVVFNGEKFVSLKRASEISGYVDDYIGQLCRSGKLKAKQVGRDWFVNLDDLLLYKNKKYQKIKKIDLEEKKSEIISFQRESKKIQVISPGLTGLIEKIHTLFQRKDVWDKELLGIEKRMQFEFKKIFTPALYWIIVLGLTAGYFTYAGDISNKAQKISNAYLSALNKAGNEIAEIKLPEVKLGEIYLSAIDNAGDAIVSFSINASNLSTKALSASAEFSVKTLSATVDLYGKILNGINDSVTSFSNKVNQKTIVLIDKVSEIKVNLPKIELPEISNTVSGAGAVVETIGNIFSKTAKSIFAEAKNGFAMFPQNLKELVQELFPTEKEKIIVKEIQQKVSQEEINFLKNELARLRESSFKVEGPLIQKTVIEKTIERIISGLTSEELDAKLQTLNNKIMAEVLNLKNQLSFRTDNTYNATVASTFQAVAVSQKIDNLSNVTINNSTITGTLTGLTDAMIPDSITASNYLLLSGGTITGVLTGTDLTLSGNLTVSGSQTIYGQITAPYFTATSTTSTSTFPYLAVSSNSNLGTVVGGTWQGSAIADTYISSATSWNNKWDLASTTIGTIYGGTGISTAPTYGKILVGTSGGVYQLQATSTLGITQDLSGYLLGSNYYATTTHPLISSLPSLSITGSQVSNLNTLWDNRFAATSTTGLAEGTNLYYTDTRARAAISETITGIDYSSGVFSLTSGYDFTTTAKETLWNNKWDLASTTIGVAYGGTGATTLTGLLQGNGAEAITGITGTAGQFPYYNGASTLLATSSIFLATSGNVGIGTTTPLAKLNVYGGNVAFQTTTNSATAFQLLNAATSSVFTIDTSAASTTISNLTVSTNSDVGTVIKGTWTGTAIDVGYGGTGQTSFGQGWLNSNGIAISASTSPTVNYITATSTTATSTFSTGGLNIGNGQFVVQQNSGNVGIGTADPGEKLTIADGNVTVNSILGTNLVTIDATCTGWTLGTGWACNGDGTIGKNSDGTGTAFYNPGMTGGSIYKIVYTLSGISGGYIQADVYEYVDSPRSNNGTYTWTFQIVSNHYLTFSPSATGVRVTINSITFQAMTEGNINLDGNIIVISGNTNSRYGYQALGSSNTGAHNSAWGYYSLSANTTGSYNYGGGNRTLKTNTTGERQTAVGYGALETGNSSYSTGVGMFALRYSGGTGNIGLGYSAGDNITTGSNNIIIGYDINAPVATADYQLNIGNAIYGDLTTGNVGIGTTAPGAKLQINTATHTSGYGSHAADRNPLLVGSSGSSIGLASIQLSSTYNDPTYSNYGLVLVNGPSTASYDVWGIMHDGPAKATGGLQFAYAAQGTNIHVATPMVTFQKSGNVGIGTTGPMYKLEVVGAGTSAGTLEPVAYFRKNSASQGGARISVNDTVIDYGSYANAGAGNFDLSFSSLVTGVQTERMRIQSNGNVGIGTTNPGAQLDLSTDSARKLTTNTWSTGSDIRIKTQVESIGDALNIISQVRPVKFHYTPEFLTAHPSVKDTDYYNFIAQEYQQVFPDSVATGTDGLLYLNSSNMIPYAIAGIKELNAKVDSIATSTLTAKQGTFDLTTLNNDLNLNGFSILNVKSIAGMNGLWRIDEGGNITAQSVQTQALTVGGGIASGVTIYDRATTQPKCIYIEGGAIKTSDGACGSTALTTGGPAAVIETASASTISETTVSTATSTESGLLQQNVAATVDIATTTPDIIPTTTSTATTTP